MESQDTHNFYFQVPAEVTVCRRAQDEIRLGPFRPSRLVCFIPAPVDTGMLSMVYSVQFSLTSGRDSGLAGCYGYDAGQPLGSPRNWKF